VHGAREAHEVLAGQGIAGEELGRQERALHLVAGLAGGDEVARVMTPAPGERDHMIQCGILDAEGGAAVDAAPSAIAKGLALDLALVLLVLQAASVAGNPARGAGESDVVEAPT
jgi:hypothetical protein